MGRGVNAPGEPSRAGAGDRAGAGLDAPHAAGAPENSAFWLPFAKPGPPMPPAEREGLAAAGEIDPATAAARVTNPAVVVHGEDDELVPIAFAAEV